jgi:hypothetical protein|tara:strand:+ start:65 stop:463 length:399 start_codon:yes stop_codon:yes gene_type:complete
MESEKIYQNFEFKMKEHLKLRHTKNNGQLNLFDVKTEFLYYLLVNNFLIKKRLANNYNITQDEIPMSEKKLLIDIQKKVFSNLMTGKVPNVEEEYQKILDAYEIHLTNPNIVDLINDHYNDLYNDHDSNILD